jgi:hypothetical protein
VGISHSIIPGPVYYTITSIVLVIVSGGLVGSAPALYSKDSRFNPSNPRFLRNK